MKYWNANRQLRSALNVAMPYIVYKYGDVWCSNSRETFAYFCTFVKKMQLEMRGSTAPVLASQAEAMGALLNSPVNCTGEPNCC